MKVTFSVLSVENISKLNNSPKIMELKIHLTTTQKEIINGSKKL